MGASGAFDVREAAPHRVLTADVGDGVVLEVLDWGGAGAPIVLLAGLGNSAHIFDDFAPALIDRGHVLGVSRRGFGASTVPPTGYDIPTLGRDIVRTLDSLGLSRATFVGHSIASEELNWLGSEHPERVTGLVYVDAAYDRVAMRASENRPKRGS
jgi:pimeloyl-ACP methyl ester carboxylesterase